MAEQTPTDPASPTGQPKASVQANEGSGQFAVYDHVLGQFVSGVGDKRTANASLKTLQADADDGQARITDGHKLEVIEV